MRTSTPITIFTLIHLTSCAALRLIDFELHPTTSSSFVCTEEIATGLEMAAENCLLNQCAAFASVISLSYSTCTTEKIISISGGVTTASGIVFDNTIETDTCINNRIESDTCKDLFVAVIPTLLSIKYTSAALPEPTFAPTSAPTTAKPVETRAPVTSAPLSSAPTLMPILSISATPVQSLSATPTVAPSITSSNSPVILRTSSPVTKTPTVTTSITNVPVTNSNDNEGNSKAAVGAVGALSGVTVILLGYLFVSWMKKRKNSTNNAKSEVGRGPLDITDTAFDNDDDVELGNKRSILSQTSDQETAMLSPGMNNDHSNRSDIDDIDYNNESLVPEDDELSSGSSTLFDVNGKNPDYDDANSSIFYESQGDEDDDEEGTELDLDGTWGPDDSPSIDHDGDGDDGDVDDDDASMPGSTISSLGASGVENFGENPSPQQFMEWIKKSPLIPAAAKASIVAAATAEAAAATGAPSSPSSLPNNFGSVASSDASGRQSW